MKVTLQRPLIMNNTRTGRHHQRIRMGADRSGKITAIAHEGWSGDLRVAGRKPLSPDPSAVCR